MQPHLEKLGVSFRSWVIYMAQLQTPLDQLLLVVMRSFLKVRGTRHSVCRIGNAHDRSRERISFFVQTPLCVVRPGRKQRGRAAAASGERLLFHPDDFQPFYDPCVPVVMVWDGHSRWWPTVSMGPQQLMEQKLVTLWQQVMEDAYSCMKSCP